MAIGCYDFGAIGQLAFRSFLLRIGDDYTSNVLNLPIDRNRNSVADAWESSKNILNMNYSSSWGAVHVEGHRVDGDGFNLYERCRGFLAMDKPNDTPQHFRLDPDKKYLFIHDPDCLLAIGGTFDTFEQATQTKLMLLGAYCWSGCGPGIQRRVVDRFSPAPFAYETHFPQHGLYIHKNESASLSPSFGCEAGWNRVCKNAKPSSPSFTITTGKAITMLKPGAPRYGGPIDIQEIQIFTHAIWQATRGCARLALSGQDAMAANSFGPDNKAYSEAIEQRTKLAILHELGQGIGILPHSGSPSAPVDCYMRYLRSDEYLNPKDPFWMNYSNWPTEYCKDCFSKIQISDDPRVDK